MLVHLVVVASCLTIIWRHGKTQEFCYEVEKACEATYEKIKTFVSRPAATRQKVAREHV